MKLRHRRNNFHLECGSFWQCCHFKVLSQEHLFSENKIKYFRAEGEQQKGRVFSFVVVHIFDYDMHVIRAGRCYRNTNKLCSKRR